MEKHSNLEKIKEFILYEEYALEEGGTIQIILDFIEWIKKNDLIKKTKLESYDNLYAYNNLDSYNIFNLYTEKKKNSYYSSNDSKISDYNTFAKIILDFKFCYVPLLLPQHLVGFFIYKVSEDNYDISIINTGGGCEYQKIFNKEIFGKKINFTNGIVMFKNINYNNALDFFEYILFIENQQNKIELDLKKFNELLYTCITDKLLNFDKINFELDVSEKNILFELPTQIIGDCSFKSFIYSLVLMDFYSIITYNISDFKISSNTNIYTKENILRSLENYWNLYYQIFIKLVDEHIKMINESNYDLFKKNYPSFKMEDELNAKIINFYISSTYIVKEKNYNNNSIYKFYSNKNLKNFDYTDSKISELIINLSKKNLDDYNTNLLTKIKDFNYWFNFPDIQYIKNERGNYYEKKINKDLNNLESLSILVDNLYLLGKEFNIKYKTNLDEESENKINFNSEDNIILNDILSKINNNMELIIYNNELENLNNYLIIYRIHKKILEFLYETKLFIYSYDDYKLIINFFENIMIKLNYGKNNSINRRGRESVIINFQESIILVRNLISSYILVRIIDYESELSSINKNICSLLFFPEFKEITERNVNKEIIQKFISKKFFKDEIFDIDIDKYIIWIQNYFQSDSIQFNFILFTIINYSKLDNFLLNNYQKKDLTDNNLNLSNYIKIIEFINKIKEDVVKDNKYIDDWINHYDKELNNEEMFYKILNFDKNSIDNLTKNDSEKTYIYKYGKNFYNTSKLITEILNNYKNYIEEKFIDYIKNNIKNNIVILFLNFIGIEHKNLNDSKIEIFYLRCLDFVNPYELEISEQSKIEEYEESDRQYDYYDDDYYGGANFEKNILKGGKKTHTCKYFKISNSYIDIHYLVECVNNSIIPDILQNNYFFIQHNYYVKNINSKNKVFENNISSFKLFNKFIKNNFEKNISSYLENIVNQIPLSINCIGLIIISCQLFLFCHSLNIQIQNSFNIKKNICDYIKLYLNDDNDIDSLTILLNCYISLIVGIDNDKLNYKNNLEIIEKLDLMKKNLVEHIVNILKYIHNLKLYESITFHFDEKYLWYLVSVPDLFQIINSFDIDYININASEIHKYNILEELQLYESSNTILIRLDNYNKSNNFYNNDKTIGIKLIVDKITNKLYNYISYYCYLLTNFFSWNKISKKYVFGRINSSDNLFNYSILYNYNDNIYYKVNDKNIDLIIDSLNLDKKVKKDKDIDEHILDEKINTYVQKCSFILDKKEILELINKFDNLTCLINKLNKFINYEQIIFWKEQNNLFEQIQIEIPEYKISFTFRPEADGILRFKNYDMDFNYDKKETLLFFNLVSNVPNFFLLKNSQDGEYYFLNMSNIFYWNIIKIHYSGLFILFENDITLLNYICNLKNYWANYIVIKNIKNNITFQKIFMKKYGDNSIEEKLKTCIKSNINILYNKTIINLTNSNYMESIYQEYSLDLNNLIDGYLKKIDTLWKKFNLPLIFQIPELYTWKKIFFDSIYLNNLNYYLNILTKNDILDLVFVSKKFINVINAQQKNKDRKNNKYNYDYDYDDYNYRGGGKKNKSKKKKNTQNINLNSSNLEEINQEEINQKEINESNLEENEKKSDIITPCEKSFKFNQQLDSEYIKEIKDLYFEDKYDYSIELNFTEDSIKCFIDTFFVEKKEIYTNTLKIINLYLEDINQRFKLALENIEKNKKDFVGGGLPEIPDLYQYKSYQDHLNQNSIILIEFIKMDKKFKSYKDKLENININIWDRWDFTTINTNPYDIKITNNIIKSLDSYDFIMYINKIILIYNDKIADLFYNSSEFRYICLLYLFKKMTNNNQLNDKKYFNINSTLSLLFYQFLMGGLVREEQIITISSILKDYGFSNTYLDIITNTYDINKKCICKELIKSNSEKSSLFSDNISLLQNKTKRNIYNLIMGSGKTKFITPIICIYVCELIKNNNLNNNMLLILPPKLINQSKIFLTYMLEYFLNINIEQIEKTNIDIINSPKSNGKLLLCSDENIKYYFLGVSDNLFTYQNWNPLTNIVLIDEADIILDPMSSEMNYPIEETKKYLNKNIYMQIINIIFKMFKSETILEAQNILIQETKILDYDIELYISFINFIKFNNINNNNIDKIFILYLQANPNSNIKKLKNINYDIYCFYDYIYNIYISIDTVWNMVNRKDFGFALENNELVTPFKYSETPMIGSEFNGIFINMMLTIKAYLYDNKINFYKLCKLMKFIITKLKNININKYKSNEFYKFIEEKFNLYNLPNILFKFNIDLTKKNNLNNLKIEINNLGLDSSIDMLSHDKDIIIMYCKYILYNNLYYYGKQLNISGIDITFSQFFNFVSGFTGTPEDKFEYIDLNPLTILRKNPKSICLERDAIKINTSVLNYKFDFNYLNKYTENYDYKNFVLSNIINYTKYNVIIDVGSVFINSTFYELAELFFKFFSHIERFIFINNNDELFYIDKKNIMSIIPWDYSIFDTDLVFFDNSHTTGIDFILPNKFIGLITMRTNTRYRDFIQGLYRLRKINSTQKADIFILPNVFTNPIVTNQLTNIIIFEKNNNSNTDNMINMINIVNTNLKIDNIIEILEINEEYYFIDQKYYFNIQQFRVIKTFYKFINSEKNPNEIIDIFNKVTNGFEDYINDKIIIEIKDIEKNYVFEKIDFIQKYFSKKYNDILNKICNIIEFYKKINSNSSIQNLSTQLQIQTQEQYQNTIEISIQTQIKKNFSNGYPYTDNKFDFTNFKSNTYENFLEVNKDSYVTEKIDKKDDYLYQRSIRYNSEDENLIYSYIIKRNNYKENNFTDTYIFTLSPVLLLSNQIPIIYDNKLYIFNNFLIIFTKNNNINIFKVGDFYEILNISNYYKNINIQYIIFDIFGNIIENYDMVPNKYELSLISNIKFYFTSLSLKNNRSSIYRNYNYMIPNYKHIFNYYQVQKQLCSPQINIMSILDLFESINLPKKYLIFELSKIYSEILLTFVLIVLRSDPLLFSNNIDVNQFIKNNFVSNINVNLDSEFLNIIDGVRKLWTENIFSIIDDLFITDNQKYNLCDKTNFKNVNTYPNSVNFKGISKCVGKILKKNKIWEKNENFNLQKSITIFKIIIRLFVPIQEKINFNLFTNIKRSDLFNIFKKYLNFINLIQNDTINLINSNDTIDNFFNS